MEERKWEELNMDCLVNVLGRVGMESLLFNVPFVCKSWYKATLNPLCWQHLDFPEISDSFESRLVDSLGSETFSASGLIKFAVNRSGGLAVSVVVPYYCPQWAFHCFVEGCPALKSLTLPIKLVDYTIFISRWISKWKNLQMLRLGSSGYMQTILPEVSLHCENFTDLGISSGYIDEDEALELVTLLPDIKYLDLRETSLGREDLVMILKGCKKLVHFDVRDNKGFECDDEILKLASHIPTFMYEGSREEDSSDDDRNKFHGFVYEIKETLDENWSEDVVTIDDLLPLPSSSSASSRCIRL
ncbi:F-box/LRR-repeat protein At3g48880-like [Cornus florida]|uniref:F-box/LRR-repeat protein At3g48880-like n=1 Tax=Cornus florida TaxID=4283 RepID=UPI00289ED894|nr:F-box/LRR-repeat protein At3g48880-like [Cornus florida]